eukprot:scaffold343_cov120-Isochrysis_galbana.AAC.8
MAWRYDPSELAAAAQSRPARPKPRTTSLRRSFILIHVVGWGLRPMDMHCPDCAPLRCDISYAMRNVSIFTITPLTWEYDVL